MWTCIESERIGDTIKIVEVGNHYEGRILNLSEYSTNLGFEINEVKWKEINKVSDNLYNFKNLGKLKSSEQIEDIKWFDFRMNVINQDTLMITTFANDPDITLQHQKKKFVRVKKIPQ